MKNLAVIGLQWGDEGKGKAIDYLAGDFDVVVRYQGGHNAGHTIYWQGKKIVLHLLPSGIFSPGTISVIGNGVVVNPLQLVTEINDARKQGISMENLEISAHAPLILPEHQQLDIVFEQGRYQKIGTTKRGIGPAYEDLTGRRAMFVKDLLDPEKFKEKLQTLNTYYNQLIKTIGGDEVTVESYVEEYIEAGKQLKPHIKNTVYSLNRYQQEGKRILFEGAQGVLLDIHFGTYPFVTSSHPTIGGLCIGTGVSHKSIHHLVGICKAYTTRVGGGPFPSELFDGEAEYLREKGGEYGATTGRPRRVGWLDLVALKYAIMINGVDEVFFTKLDVLDTFDKVNVVTHYNINGQETDMFEPSSDALLAAKPVLKSFNGWKTPTDGMREYSQLPEEARRYIAFVEEFIGVPLRYISVGANRDQTIKHS